MKTAPKRVHPIILFFGGKSRVAAKIIKLFPPHHCYAEVFAGGLSVLLTKEPSKHEVVNDYDTELAWLMKMIKFRLGEMLEGIEGVPVGRKMFEDFLRADVALMNDVDRAVRKLYIIRMSYSGIGKYFGTDKKRSRFKHDLIKGWITEFQGRMASVVIERLDAQNFIPRYDSPETFFYLDPVYFKKDDGYAQHFGGLDRHAALRDSLAAVKGKWLLSHHDCPEIRKLYKGYKFRKLEVPYSVHQKGDKKRVMELLISNY